MSVRLFSKALFPPDLWIYGLFNSMNIYIYIFIYLFIYIVDEYSGWYSRIWMKKNYIWLYSGGLGSKNDHLVGGLEHFLFIHIIYILRIIIPIDELRFFRWVGLNHQPVIESQDMDMQLQKMEHLLEMVTETKTTSWSLRAERFFSRSDEIAGNSYEENGTVEIVDWPIETWWFSTLIFLFTSLPEENGNHIDFRFLWQGLDIVDPVLVYNVWKSVQTTGFGSLQAHMYIYDHICIIYIYIQSREG